MQPADTQPAQQPPQLQQQPPKNNKGLVIGLIIAIVAVVIASVVAIVVLRGRADAPAPVSTDEPATEQEAGTEEQPAQTQPVMDASSQEITAFIDYGLDLDGDGDLETLRVENNGSDDGWTFRTLSIYVDGKLASERTDEYGVGSSDYYDYRAITLSSGRTVLYIYTPIYNGDAPVCGLFRYNENTGTFEEEVDLNAFFSWDGRYGNHVNGTFNRVDNDSIYIDEFIMSWTAGTLDVQAQYRYNPDGTMELVNAENLPVDSWAQNENGYLTLSYETGVNSGPEVTDNAGALHAGQRVTIESAYVVDGVFSLELKPQGESGTYWIRCAEDYDDLPFNSTTGGTIFDESMLAG